MDHPAALAPVRPAVGCKLVWSMGICSSKDLPRRNDLEKRRIIANGCQPQDSLFFPNLLKCGATIGGTIAIRLVAQIQFGLCKTSEQQ